MCVCEGGWCVCVCVCCTVSTDRLGTSTHTHTNIPAVKCANRKLAQAVMKSQGCIITQQ